MHFAGSIFLKCLVGLLVIRIIWISICFRNEMMMVLDMFPKTKLAGYTGQ